MDPPPQFPHLWDGLGAYLRGIAERLPTRPTAALVISAHWDEPVATLNVAERPPLLFDYYGFPEHTYRLSYPAPGAPKLAGRVRSLLSTAGFDSDATAQRGFDHGVFVPFMLMFPDASVPILQLSLQTSLDPAWHVALGRALVSLRDEGVLIVGSGLSYHNLAALFSAQGAEPAAAFDAWLGDAVADPTTRDQKLIDWRAAPGSREAHPHAEHLLPLMVAAGAAGGDPGVRTFGEAIAGKAVSGFQFG
jgi:aromatic ring-opening dioxygenase catalytic subunit (LigB family)